ncbi:NYN domain-containing protein [uncultured Kocuria sp.]|uniref:NYN domain-containing protein n=1 Tax=uncultured Kocuria sp. TaxID=259305 RepID=UPI00260EAF07|nr:NYN domain-containing protein [uncultured Kocuria sp.]
MQQWEAVLHTYAIRPTQQFDYSTGKNASDMAMVIDAMDLLHAGSVDGFAVVSGDADFTPLVMRILTEGAKVYGFGQRQTPEPFINACSQFTYVEGLGESVPENQESPESPVTALTRVPQQKLRGDARLVKMLRSAVDAAGGEDGWANLAAVGHQIGNQASFDPRNYGYAKLSGMVEATGLFDVRRQSHGVFVRDNRRK